MKLMLELHLTVELEDEKALATAVEDRLSRLPAADRMDFVEARTDAGEALQLLFEPDVVLEGAGLRVVSHSAISGPAD